MCINLHFESVCQESSINFSTKLARMIGSEDEMVAERTQAMCAIVDWADLSLSQRDRSPWLLVNVHQILDNF